jgi:hypothetical protein
MKQANLGAPKPFFSLAVSAVTSKQMDASFNCNGTAIYAQSKIIVTSFFGRVCGIRARAAPSIKPSYRNRVAAISE